MSSLLRPRRWFRARRSRTRGEIAVRVASVVVALACLSFSLYVVMHGSGRP